MENSGNVMFEDDTSEWFVAVGEPGKWMGPLAAADVYAKILSQELTWAHFVWREGEKDWQRICDTKTFQVAVPSAPKSATKTAMLNAIKQAAKPAKKASSAPPAAPGEEVRTWFLYYNTTQFGPFSESEISKAITSGKIHGRVHAWHEGMSGWERLEKLDTFGDALKQITRADTTRVMEAGTQTGMRARTPLRGEQREAPRSPLVAKIILASPQEAAVTVAMCRDISVGGMQVLTDKIPGAVGSRIKMNVSAASGLEPFVAEGVIVRILEDKRGFSFRFEKLSPAARGSIESYIEQIGSGG